MIKDTYACKTCSVVFKQKRKQRIVIIPATRGHNGPPRPLPARPKSTVREHFVICPECLRENIIKVEVVI